MTTEDKEYMKTVPYVSVVGSLMYVMLCTRPYICYSIGIVSSISLIQVGNTGPLGSIYSST